MNQRNIQNIQQQFTLSFQTWVQARAHADALGLTVSEYVSLLVDEDKNPTRRQKKILTFPAPLTKEAEERYDRDIKEFEKQEKKHPQKAAQSAEELVQMLEHEVD